MKEENSKAFCVVLLFQHLCWHKGAKLTLWRRSPFDQRTGLIPHLCNQHAEILSWTPNYSHCWAISVWMYVWFPNPQLWYHTSIPVWMGECEKSQINLKGARKTQVYYYYYYYFTRLSLKKCHFIQRKHQLWFSPEKTGRSWPGAMWLGPG